MITPREEHQDEEQPETQALPAAPRWHVLEHSECGAAHKRAGQHNQDAVLTTGRVQEGGLILAVADGHGSAKSFRSAKGAQFAVESAFTVLKENLHESPEDLRKVQDRLPRPIVEDWRTRVTEDRDCCEVTEDEKHLLLEHEGSAGWRAIEKNHYLPYGSTLVATLISDKAIVYLQLGDGDILVVDEQGTVTRPLEPDPRLLGNETTSLCQDDAATHVRIAVRPVTTDTPALIFLATDGYANSFRDDEDFKQVASDLLAAIHEYGVEAMRQQLPAILADASERGSGDDISVVCAVRVASEGAHDARGELHQSTGRIDDATMYADSAALGGAHEPGEGAADVDGEHPAEPVPPAEDASSAHTVYPSQPRVSELSACRTRR